MKDHISESTLVCSRVLFDTFSPNRLSVQASLMTNGTMNGLVKRKNEKNLVVGRHIDEGRGK